MLLSYTEFIKWNGELRISRVIEIIRKLYCQCSVMDWHTTQGAFQWVPGIGSTITNTLLQMNK